MKPFRKHKGVVAHLDRENVDTDQIIPKQFLKRIERTGYGPFLFSAGAAPRGDQPGASHIRTSSSITPTTRTPKSWSRARTSVAGLPGNTRRGPLTTTDFVV